MILLDMCHVVFEQADLAAADETGDLRQSTLSLEPSSVLCQSTWIGLTGARQAVNDNVVPAHDVPSQHLVAGADVATHGACDRRVSQRLGGDKPFVIFLVVPSLEMTLERRQLRELLVAAIALEDHHIRPVVGYVPHVHACLHFLLNDECFSVEQTGDRLFV